MVPIPNYKDIMTLIKKGATVEAQEQIMAMREAALDLQDQNFVLRQENAQLKQRLDIEGKMQFKKPFYYQEGDEQAFCPKCWESKSLAIHLGGPFSGEDMYTQYECPECKKSYHVDPDSDYYQG